MKKTSVDVKFSNRKMVFDLIRAEKRVCRADLGQKTGLSGPTILKIMQYFIDYGIVSEVGIGETKLGRKPTVFEFNKDFAKIISVLLEGKYAKIGLLDASGNILKHESKEIQKSDELFLELARHCNQIYDGEVLGIGVGIPAKIDPSNNTINFAPAIGILKPEDMSPYHRVFSENYNCQTFFENDVRSLALAEHASFKDDLGVISVGTGVGLAIINDQNMVRGKRNFAGEIGYMNFDISDMDKKEDDLTHGWLERKIGLLALGQKFSVDIKNPDTITYEVIDYVARYIAMVIVNISVVTDTQNFFLGGVLMEQLDDRFLKLVDKYIKNKSIAYINVKFSKVSELVGLSHLVIENTMKQILLKDEN